MYFLMSEEFEPSVYAARMKAPEVGIGLICLCVVVTVPLFYRLATTLPVLSSTR